MTDIQRRELHSAMLNTNTTNMDRLKNGWRNPALGLRPKLNGGTSIYPRKWARQTRENAKPAKTTTPDAISTTFNGFKGVMCATAPKHPW